MDRTQLYQLIEQWAGTAATLPELPMRTQYLYEHFSSLPPPSFADALDQLIRQAETGNTGCHLLLICLVDLDPFLQKLGRPYFSEVYRQARELELTAVLDFLSDPRPAAGLPEDPAPVTGQLAHDLPLGQRRSLARQSVLKTIERLMTDPHPLVIRQLLQNPRLTVEMVIRLAARRPNRIPVLREIVRHPKWISQPAVQAALARNPYSPPGLVMRLLPCLKLQDLQELAGDATLLPAIRQAARAALDRRPH